jgi:itaconyl-CoA hydratase
MSAGESVAKEWSGRFYEDFDTGDIFRSRMGRTIAETDNTWFANLTMNTNQLHFNAEYARRSRFGRPLVVSTLTLALVTGLSVADTSENAVANLSWDAVPLPNPFFVGDTLWAESEILMKRESGSDPTVGIVTMRTRGLNQRCEVVIEFKRTFMIPRRHAGSDVRGWFPATDDEWRTT